MATKKRRKPLNPDDEKRKFGQRIKQLRKQAGYSSAEKFANDNGFVRPTYGKWEKGDTELNIGFDNIIRLANSYGVSLAELFIDAGE